MLWLLIRITINKATAKCPVNIHDVIIPNVLDLGVDIIATKSILK